MKYFLIAIAVISFIIIVEFIIIENNSNLKTRFVGKKGERLAKRIIKKGLNKDDILLTNVLIKHEDRKCECDDIIINKYGVFVIEVKYYKGHLSGNFKDDNWKKTKISKNGIKYTQLVKNPFRQVNRNVDILSKYLSNNDQRSFVKGYVMAPNNIQIVGRQVLKNSDDVDREIHYSNYTKEKNYLSRDKQNKIYKLIK